MADNQNFRFDNYNMSSENGYGAYTGSVTDTLSQYTAKAFLWMMAGLLVTFGVAFGFSNSSIFYRLYMAGGGNALTALLIGASIAEFAVVILLSARIQKMAVTTARILFFAYAALTGLTFSTYFVLLDVSYLVVAFGIAALFFGGMAAMALIFKMELSSIRPYLFGALIMLLVFGLIGAFTRIAWLDLIVCYFGVAVFMAYTAYDVSKIKNFYYYYSSTGDQAMLSKSAIFSALQLYLDFVNLFLYILRILLSRRSRR